MKKNKLLIIYRYYYLGGKGGGPINSINQLINSNDGFINNSDFYLYTDKPFTFESPVREDRIICKSLFKALVKQRFEIVYCNSFFDPLLLKLILIKLIFRSVFTIYISPRGELMEGAIASNSEVLKRIYIRIVRFLIRGNSKVTFVFTNIFERNQAVVSLGFTPKYIYLQNQSQVKKIHPQKPRYDIKQNSLKIIWFSRITPKKNLEYLLEVLMKCSRNIYVDVYGSCDDESYLNSLISTSNKLPKNINIKFCGFQNFSELKQELPNYDLFFLATKGENYGHAIVEAMLYGIPCLISNCTPWLGLSENGIGWDIELSKMNEYLGIIENFELKWNSIQNESKRVNYLNKYVLNEK